jgi:hypothetical protein
MMPSKILRPEGKPARRPEESQLKKETEGLLEEMRNRQRPLLDDLLCLTTCVAYVERLLRNIRISKYLHKNHGATLARVKELLARIRQTEDALEEGTMTVWSIALAKKKLGEIIMQAKNNGPQLIRTYGDPVVVVVSLRRWNAMLRRYPELEEFFWGKGIPQARKSVPSDPGGKTGSQRDESGP